MQTLSEIRSLLKRFGLRPNRAFGQSFLIDKNLMGKLLELAELSGDQTVLEVGPATGSLTEELLTRAGRVVAVEIDRGFYELLQQHLGDRENLTLICGDVLSSKHEIAPTVLDAIKPRAVLVANLPYNIATPLIADCLIGSWRSNYRFDRLTFTVQEEVAQRLNASCGSSSYGSVSVLVSLLGRVTMGPIIQRTAFFPSPKVASRIVRIDFDEDSAGDLMDIDVLRRVLNLAFGQRRKQIGSLVRRKEAQDLAGSPEALADAMRRGGIDMKARPQRVAPGAFAALANFLSGGK